ncbi:MAG: hypothetical protein NZ518_10325, partial [Dehalococcoidia bacterium]|nr:hypothetical protein [Dehalococcoidia bacterium]
MPLSFVRGSADRPRGHAILSFTVDDRVVATYVVVPPIAINLAKYLPPMFAGQVNLAETPEIAAVPL